MKGIILAGGRGSRLYPITLGICKQLLPIYDKPMIYYSLSVLLMAGIDEILLIGNRQDIPHFQSLLGDGSFLGIKISYAVQERPEGIAQSFIIAEEFIAGDTVALILGDNLFYGHNLSAVVSSCKHLEKGAVVFAYEVKDPERYGVIEFDETGKVTDIVEKPQVPKSRFAVTGLYFYDESVVEIAKSLKPSHRGEYEITDVNRVYLERGELQVSFLDRGFAWLDTGTPEALQQASQYVQAIQNRQGVHIGCLEEIAFNRGLISQEQLEERIALLGNNEYSAYLQSRCLGSKASGLRLI